MTINNRQVINAAYQRGYVSRKTDLSKQPILKGRKGEYILAPCFDTTRYCKRLYLA